MMKDTLYGLTKGTEMEDTIGKIANAEVMATKRYYAVARMAEEQGLPDELVKAFREVADQESAHAGFYATLNAEYPEDILSLMQNMVQGELNAKKVLQPLADKLRQMGGEKAANEMELYIEQELHHGEKLQQLLDKYKAEQ